jgi:hypothetical protein
MTEYKIITETDGFVLKKKDNCFKLEASKKVSFPCDVIEIIERFEIYNLLKLLNENIITKTKIIYQDQTNKSNPDILLFFNNIFQENKDDEDEDEEDEDKDDEDEEDEDKDDDENDDENYYKSSSSGLYFNDKETNKETNKKINKKTKKYYVSFNNEINKISKREIKVFGKANNIKIDLDTYKKIEIDNILLHVKLNSKSELQVLFKFNYVGEKIPIYVENTIGLLFRKLFKNLITWYS